MIENQSETLRTLMNKKKKKKKKIVTKETQATGFGKIVIDVKISFNNIICNKILHENEKEKNEYKAKQLKWGGFYLTATRECSDKFKLSISSLH